MIPQRRLKACVEAWPDCWVGEYNPRCCRFPKSCSCTVYDPLFVKDSDLEPPWQPHRHFMVVCEIHKRIISQCDHTSAYKERTDVNCPGDCYQRNHS